MTASQLLTVPAAAERLAISRHTLRGWISKRQVEVVRLGRAVRLRASEVERIIQEGAHPPATIWAESREPRAASREKGGVR